MPVKRIAVKGTGNVMTNSSQHTAATDISSKQQQSQQEQQPLSPQRSSHAALSPITRAGVNPSNAPAPRSTHPGILGAAANGAACSSGATAEHNSNESSADPAQGSAMGAQPAYTLEAQPRNDSLAPQNMAKPPKQEPQAPSGKGVGAVERVEETSQEKAQRTQREDALLAQARAIRKSRDKKLPPVWHPPKQGRLHWDALLEEMQWLAKEFQKERAWKLKQSRKYALAAQRSNMDVESRIVVKQKEEEKALRKRAAWIGKEVMTFWSKAQRVVLYKLKTEMEARKKEVMDKQLDLLLGQTQKYSSMLAERLAKEEQEAAAAAAAATGTVEGGGNSAGPGAVAETPDSQGAAEDRCRGQQAQHDEAQQAQHDQPATLSRAGSGVGGGSSVDGDESGDYVSGQDDDADDEGTLEEEERLAAQEAGGADPAAQQAAEVAGLGDDADLPLEQLLARYGYVVPGEGDAVMAEADFEAGTLPAGEAVSEAMEGSDAGIDALLEDPFSADAAQQGDVALSRPSRLAAELAAVDSDSEGDTPGPSARPVRASSESEEEGDYVSGQDDDADDEGTLEEEERLAAQEAGAADLAAQQAAEVAGLGDDADIPIEQLLPPEMLARYGIGTGGPKPKPSQGIDATSVGDGQGMTGNGRAEEHSMPSRLAEELADVASDGEEMDDGPSGSREVEEDESRDYVSGQDDDADDEGTLEEEERLAAQEAGGADLAAQQAAELAGLGDDADVPIEQLLPPEMLARYGLGPCTAKDDVEMEEASAALPPALPSAQRRADAAAAQQAQHATAAVKPEPQQHIKQEPADAAPQHCPAPADVASADVDKGCSDDEDTAPEGIDAAMAAMAGLQPLGSTLDTVKVKTRAPFLLKGQLREYQHIGLDWLVTLYQKRLNGILADEMGLGKTIQTISLLAHLACEKGDWGPHLVVVPTSVMLNWEMEFKKWCPAFKLLTYFGGVKERAAKRQGWSKPNAFHVCITSYTLVLQDARMFKRKKWKYLILDEAHMIKNWKSQRWQTLLNFNSKRRLLITGTPLQNDLMELWSLMHFLMPQVFASHAQFKDWFSNPLTGMVEGSAEMNRAIVERLHAVLRPFLLRRLKRDVEKQLPQKHEHVIYCRLSKRQRQLYEEYMHNSDTRATLSSGNFLGIMNCLMQLRKVCNHPDLFEGRAIVSAYDMEPLRYTAPRAVLYARLAGPFDEVDWRQLDLVPLENEGMAAWEAATIAHLALLQQAFSSPATSPQEDVQLLFRSAQELTAGGDGRPGGPGSLLQSLPFQPKQSSLQAVIASIQAVTTRRRLWRRDRTQALGQLSIARTARRPLYGYDLVQALGVEDPVAQVHLVAHQQGRHMDYSSLIRDAIKLPAQRARELDDTMKAFCFVIPKARAAPPTVECSRPDHSVVNAALRQAAVLQQEYTRRNALLHVPRIRTQLFFPDRRLIQFDCGKLQELSVLLRKLKAGGHKALIFTQMSKMLDVLEVFLNLHAYTYVRLDGSTKPEERQILMQRFNTDPKLFVFILSTRSGGVGMNLIGADNVIFYDSDWNPAMDAQAQDRCHRIGQTREVHIWRLVSEHTIEENILKKSDQKRQLDWLAIQSGGFTTDAMLTKFDPKAILGLSDAANGGKVSDAEMAAAMRAAEDEGDAEAAAALEKETAAEMEEFTREPPAQAAEGEGEGEDGGAAGGVSQEGRATPEPSGGGGAPPTPQQGGGACQGEDEAMADVVAMAGGAGGTVGQLESVLRPVEKYAVRMLENSGEGVDKEAFQKQVEATYKVEELDIDQIERQEEEREADIDEDSEQNLVLDWDQEAADEAYKAQVEAAQREEEERKEAEERWLKEYNAMLAQSVPLEASGSLGVGNSWGAGKGGKSWRGSKATGYDSADTTASGGRGRRGSPGLPSVRVKDEDGDYVPGGRRLGWGVRRRRSALEGVSPRAALSPRSVLGAPTPLPWQVQEDFVLCCAARAELDQGGATPGDTTWQGASAALQAGAAATSLAGVQAAAGQGARRTPQACQQRYSLLVAAYRAAVLGQQAALSSAMQQLRARLRSWLSGRGEAQQQQQEEEKDEDGAAAGGNSEGGAGAAVQLRKRTLAAAQNVLRRSAGAAGEVQGEGSELQRALQKLVEEEEHAREVREGGAKVENVTAPEAQAVLAAVRKLLGDDAAQGLAARLQAILAAGMQGGVRGCREALLASFSRSLEHPRTAPPGGHQAQQPQQLVGPGPPSAARPALPGVPLPGQQYSPAGGQPVAGHSVGGGMQYSQFARPVPPNGQAGALPAQQGGVAPAPAAFLPQHAQQGLYPPQGLQRPQMSHLQWSGAAAMPLPGLGAHAALRGAGAGAVRPLLHPPPHQQPQQPPFQAISLGPPQGRPAGAAAHGPASSVPSTTAAPPLPAHLQHQAAVQAQQQLLLRQQQASLRLIPGPAQLSGGFPRPGGVFPAQFQQGPGRPTTSTPTFDPRGMPALQGAPLRPLGGLPQGPGVGAGQQQQQPGGCPFPGTAQHGVAQQQGQQMPFLGQPPGHSVQTLAQKKQVPPQPTQQPMGFPTGFFGGQ